MTGAYLAFRDPGHPWFTACLGLTVAELAAPGDGRHAAIGKAASIATESRDAYVAAEILKSPLAGTATRGTVTDLNGMVIQSGLGQPLTAVQEKHLTASASTDRSRFEPPTGARPAARCRDDARSTPAASSSAPGRSPPPVTAPSGRAGKGMTERGECHCRH